MILKKKLLAAFALAIMIFTFAASPAKANDKDYDAVVKHLKTKYRAKKVKIPFMWLARAAVSVARPAGVKSFNLTVFENLNFSRATLDQEMQAAMRNSMSPDWSPIFHIRSRDGEQAYMYMRESGDDVKIMLVTIDRENATVIRARFSPDKLVNFIDNPKIFGISIDDNDKSSNTNVSEAKSLNNEKKPADPKEDK